MVRLPVSSSLLQATLRTARPAAQSTSRTISASRHFSGLPTLRPSLTNPAHVFRARATPSAAFQPSTTTTTGEGILDLVPRTAISAHPALSQIQIRCGPRPTLSGATRLIQKRRHGFLSRIRTAKGRKLLARRRAKGRKRLSA